MNTPSMPQKRLIELLRELPQLNQPDLAHGLNRIMHTKSRKIEQDREQDG